MRESKKNLWFATLFFIVNIITLVATMSNSGSEYSKQSNSKDEYFRNYPFIQTLLQGDQGNPTYGDLFGTANFLIPFNGTDQAIIGALYGVGIPFPNGTTKYSAGRVYFYSGNEKWIQFQQPYIGASAGNEAGVSVSGGDGWLFVGEPGNPLNDSNPANKISSGNVDVFKYNPILEKYLRVQQIPNPLGNGQDQAGAQFGLSLGYSNGWLVVGGGNTNTAWLFSFDQLTQTWTQKVKIVTNAVGALTVAIGGQHAFIQVPYVISNAQVLVYKKTLDSWTYLQTINGFWNTGNNMSFIGDLFGSPMSISNGWAVIGASGDGTYGQNYPTLPTKLGGAAYFVQLQDNGYWNVTQKVFSDSPNIFYGMGNCILNDVAFITDMGRTGPTGNKFQGAFRRYVLQGSMWIPRELRFDPQGRAYDYFSQCSVTNDHFLGASFRAATEFLNDPTFVGPSQPGRVVIWGNYP